MPLLVTLAFLAASCGGSPATAPPASTTTAKVARVVTPVPSTGNPRADARTALGRCRAALAPLGFGQVAAADLDAVKGRLAAARSACGLAGGLTTLAQNHTAEASLGQAAAAATAIADGLANYEKYLGHLTAGTNGSRILSYAAEELRQGKLLLAEALKELG